MCDSPASASKPKGASRIRNFKNHGRNLEVNKYCKLHEQQTKRYVKVTFSVLYNNLQDLRRRQVEMNVELRKVKKEDQLTKRRNLNIEHASKIDESLNIEDIVRG